jgi:2-dehydro-3-deoxygluconokinase
MDLVTFGEAMLRLTPPGFGRLEAARSLDAYVGGAELNVAVAGAHLGLRARWVSCLPENAIGRMIAAAAREEGVDVSKVAWMRDTRAGLYFVEVGSEPSGTAVTYDRAGSAITRMAPGTIDWPDALRGTRWFHVSGITPALSDSTRATLTAALEAASGASGATSYDLNYRPALWGDDPRRALAAQEPLLREGDIDVFIASHDAARFVFGLSTETPEQTARQLAERYGFGAVAITLRDSATRRHATWSAIIVANDDVHASPAFDCRVLDPIGAGDAFCAGLIHARLAGESWDTAAARGAALAALKHQTAGDFSRATMQDVERLTVVAATRGRP